ncbi:tubulin-specific chaperone E [Onthophagus taurus]|uniref:tubulin-specific chaperone E n=1 Tax=Onthophagus taurus TaxID=166361 RepID=UPI000C2072A2|nr:tubulin-specific chaperone E [Onthophagus taurus]
MMLNNCERTPVIGNRIECLGYIGTIKYIGQVSDYAGIWIGVDWDDPTRGKHNGTIKGVCYFEASFPTSGSFVRPEKVNLGQTAVTALTSRYGRHDDDVTAKLHEQQLQSVQQCINAPFLKLVGFDKITDKQSDFWNLKVVNLRLQSVYTSGDPGSIRALCPNIIELDISKNLIKSWLTIFDICSQLDNLEWLNVSENILEFPPDLDDYCYGSVRVLICNAMKLTWNNVLQLGKIFPNLEELRVPNNNITTLDTPEDHKLVHLKLLDLENNLIQNWEEILKLKFLKNLEQMILENIKLNKIYFEDQEKIIDFSHLKKLVLTNNLINDWESVGELNKLQKLEDLKFINNPILDKESFVISTELIIARLENLKVLNGTTLQSDERRGAEYRYLKKYGLEYLSLKDYDQRKEFLKKHNRYDDLITKHGMPEESEMKTTSKIIKGTLTELQIIFNERIIRKKLPPSMLVQKLGTLVQKLFQLTDRPTLIYTSNTKSNIEINLNDDCKELGFYSMQDGDRILVQM